MAAIDGYHFLQFPAIDSLLLVSQAASIISSENGSVLSVPEINAILPLSTSLMIMFLDIPSPRDDFLCLPKTDAISSEPNTVFTYSGMARFWNIAILSPFRERYLPVAMFIE